MMKFIKYVVFYGGRSLDVCHSHDTVNFYVCLRGGDSGYCWDKLASFKDCEDREFWVTGIND